MSTLIDELLNRNPMDLDSKDIDKIVAYFREEREKWQAKETTRKPRKSRSIDPDALGFDFSKLKK